MNINSPIGVVRQNGIGRSSTSTNPTGWFVREKIDPATGKATSLELGIYLTDDIFLSVPVHYSLKGKFSQYSMSPICGYNYYVIPKSFKFAVSKYVSKRTNLENVILVAPSEENTAVFITCFTCKADIGAIINCTFPNSTTKVLRKYIDKDRQYVGVIAFNEDKDTINPGILINVKEGVLGTKVCTSTTYTFDCMGTQSSESEALDVEEPVATEFINMPLFIEPVKKPRDETSKVNTGYVKTYNKPANNYAKKDNYRSGSGNQYSKDDSNDSDNRYSKKYTAPVTTGDDQYKPKNTSNRYETKKNFKNRRDE